MKADEIHIYPKEEIIILKGNVKVIGTDGNQMTGERAEYSQKDKVIEIFGSPTEASQIQIRNNKIWKKIIKRS